MDVLDPSAPATLHVVGAAIARGETCLVARRGPSMSLAGKWEFPGGKVEVGESAPDALAREILEELGW
jgi:mutator protein MutT